MRTGKTSVTKKASENKKPRTMLNRKEKMHYYGVGKTQV